MSARARSIWGWGYEDSAIGPAEAAAAAPGVEALFGFPAQAPEEAVPFAEADVPAPQAQPPDGELGAICSTERRDRALHARGSSYLDTIRAFRGHYPHPPDFVARPANEGQVEALLEWAGAGRVAVIPYGGGTSVVGGVEPDVPDGYNGTCSLDLGALDRVVEVDGISRAALIEAGAAGPRLEEQLAAQGMTMRFYPQSFECSTLGGWIATRAGGHFATRATHVDDLVESVRAITPAGAWESRRLPGSGAGPSPDRMLLGSEGTLGVITRAWVRVQPRPEHRAGRSVRFPDFAAGVEASRELAQSGLDPANCRLIDELEAQQTGSGDGSSALLVLGFESTDAPVEHDLARALEVCASHGGQWDEPSGEAGAAGAWREAFLRMPYLRDMLVQLGVMADTFETAITWERFPAFHEQVAGAVRDALGEPCRVTCRFTHLYPDGPAPYYTVIVPARRGDEVAQWHEMKEAAGMAILAAGGTITHHHAVGRDHRPWYDEQRPEPFAAALGAAKRELDPAGILNPGVLVG
ncbi:MAG: FAD-binding oxidoreductase [Solirubrobacteraceae bacterium]|nr:FAD-binding oxidoreductase [Solirubrobacteraceae bacterium]